MELPEGKTEQQVLDAVENAVRHLAGLFVFAYYDIDDIRQEIRAFCLEALPRYDCKRPLENFLFSHARNRLINLKRNKVRRTDSPCPACHRGTPCSDAGYCDKYVNWLRRNDAKADLSRPAKINSRAEPVRGDENALANETDLKWALAEIDAHLPIELRAVWLQMRAGVNVPKAKRLPVEEAIRSILPELDRPETQ